MSPADNNLYIDSWCVLSSAILVGWLDICAGYAMFLKTLENVILFFIFTKYTVSLTNKFSQHEFIQLFFNCTIHFSLKENTGESFFTSILNTCIGNRYCVSIQTRQDRYSHSPIWKTEEYEDLSPLYPCVFILQRYSTVCVVQLPSMPEIKFEDYDNPYLLRKLGTIIKYTAQPAFNINQIIPTSPNYILLPTSIPPDYHNHPDLPVPKYYRSRLILLNDADNRIFMGCSLCHGLQHLMEHENDQTEFTPCVRTACYAEIQSQIVPVPNSEKITLKSLDAFWIRLHSNLQTYNPYGYSSDPFDFECDIRNLHLHTFGHTLEDPFHCSLQFILSHHNGSQGSTEVKLHFSTNFGYASSDSSLLRNGGGDKRYRFFPIGSQFHGFQYTMFIPLRSRYNQMHVNFLALFQPLDWGNWITLLISSVLLRTVLKRMGMVSSYFWIFAAFLEQSEEKQGERKIKYKNYCLLWLLGTLVIRHVYTSSLYSYITAGPEPAGLPESLRDLLISKNFSIITEYVLGADQLSIDLLLTLFIEDQNNKFGEFVKKISHRPRQFLLTSDTDALRNVIYNISQFLPVTCCAPRQRKAQNSNCNITGWLETTHNLESLGLLHHSRGRPRVENYDWTEADYETRYLPRVIAAFGNRLMHYHYDPPELSHGIIWYSYMDNCFQEVFQHTLATIVESGLFERQEMYHEKMIQVRYLKYVNEHEKFNKSCNFWTLGMYTMSEFVHISDSFQDNHGVAESCDFVSLMTVWSVFLIMVVVAVVIFAFEWEWLPSEEQSCYEHTQQTL